jgi:hypothetical protein
MTQRIKIKKDKFPQQKKSEYTFNNFLNTRSDFTKGIILIHELNFFKEIVFRYFQHFLQKTEFANNGQKM